MWDSGTLNHNPSEDFGFVYELTYEDGKKYIGKKQFGSYLTGKAKKDGTPRKGHIRFFNRNVKGKRTVYEEYRKESNWEKYEGSNDYNVKVKSKKFLYIAKSKRELTYLETKALFVHDAIIDANYVNGNILNKFFRQK